MDHMTWDELFANARRFVQNDLPSPAVDGRALLLQPQSRAASLWQLAIALCSGRRVILDEKSLVDPVDYLTLSNDQWLNAESHTYIHGSSEKNSFFELNDLQLTLCTSGSTGLPKMVEKSGPALMNEVRDLQALYGIEAGQHLLSLVSPFHIYGLLHSFLLPWSSHCSVQFVNFTLGLIDLKSFRQRRFKLVIGVPATWSFVKDLLDEDMLENLVMSGAPFGGARSQQLRQREKQLQQTFEILGSTETGGLGYRSLLDEKAPFQPMPGVKFSPALVGCLVFSPYLWPQESLEIADQLEFLQDGRFFHRGRMDRIFKYAGQRFSLTEVENIFSLFFGDAEIVARFQDKETIAQGGSLVVWIEADEIKSLDELRQFYRQRTRAPFPQTLHWVPEFMRDAQGKIDWVTMSQKQSAPKSRVSLADGGPSRHCDL